MNDDFPVLNGPPPRLMTYDDVCKLTGLVRSTVYRAVQAGTFPQPIRIGRSVRFMEREIIAWIATQPRQTY